MSDAPTIAAILLAGRPDCVPLDDATLAHQLCAAYRLLEMDERRDRWIAAERCQQLNETPCRDCGEMPGVCDCIPF